MPRSVRPHRAAGVSRSPTVGFPSQQEPAVERLLLTNPQAPTSRICTDPDGLLLQSFPASSSLVTEHMLHGLRGCVSFDCRKDMRLSLRRQDIESNNIPEGLKSDLCGTGKPEDRPMNRRLFRTEFGGTIERYRVLTRVKGGLEGRSHTALRGRCSSGVIGQNIPGDHETGRGFNPRQEQVSHYSVVRRSVAVAEARRSKKVRGRWRRATSCHWLSVITSQHERRGSATLILSGRA